MTLKLNSALCGHKYDKAGRFVGAFSHAAGAEVEWHDENEARRMVERGIATEVKKSTK